VSRFRERNRQRLQTFGLSSSSDSARADRKTWWVSSTAVGARAVVLSFAFVALTTVGILTVGSSFPPNLIPLIYMLPVVLAAIRWGTSAGLIAAFAGAAAADFFFYPPIYSFWLQSGQDVVHLLVYLVVGIVTSNLASRLKEEAHTSRRRESEIGELHAFSQGLATCLTSRDLLFAIQDYLSNTLGYRAVLLASAPGEDASEANSAAIPEQIRREAQKLIAANAHHGSIVVEPLISRAWLVKAIMPEILGYGAIAIELGYGSRALVRTVAKHVEAMLEEATVTLKHLKAKEAIAQATINYQTEILRDALVGGVSHELRSPIASILGSCSVLGKMPAVKDDGRSQLLVEAIHDQAAQLDSHIRDLLDVTRISANGVRPQLLWTDPTDIVASALKQKQRRLATHRLVVDLGDPPLVQVDSVLVEQALGQLLENAAKYSPAGTQIRIGCRSGPEGYLDLSVTDQGSGLTAEEKRELGKRCYRGERHAIGSGSGLGLWIASTFIAANGGCLFAESEGLNLGTTISLRLPIGSQDTPESPETDNE
jgi:two-component system sensor histidine kinase KdpD